jgi:hypothetical protein
MTSLQADPAELAATFALFAPPGAVIEMRALHTSRGTWSGYFDNAAAFVEAGLGLNGAGPGTYVTMNPVKPDLLARKRNRIEGYAKHTTADADIVARRYVVVDCDVELPAGISSTDTEHAAALAVARVCRTWLVEQLGFPAEAFILADSGNGAHLLVRVDLPNDAASRVLVQRGLEALALFHRTGMVKIDTTVGNAARIVKLYGTVAAKGDPSPERPHRRSGILELPPCDVVPVRRALLERLAALVPESPRTERHAGTGGDFDVRAWLAGHHIEVVRERPWRTGDTVLELDGCPIGDHAHHRNEAVVILFASGAVDFRCQHQTCQGIKWAQFREHFDGPRDRRQHGPKSTIVEAAAADGTAGHPVDQRPGLLGADDGLEQQTTFRRLRDFLAEPDETANWVVDGLLPAGGLSLLGAKPKVGKSTLARYIGHCVASDVPCLSRPTSRGPVLYVSIEERRRDVRAHFGLLGGAGDLDLLVHVGPVPGTPTGATREAVRRHRIAWLTREIRRFRPVLVIIDTWGRFVAVKDGNDYAEATEASEALIELARSSGTHLLFTHHAKKSEAELIDSLLGSMAIVGSVDTVLLERRQRDKTRTLESNQRVGDDLDETVLVLDKDIGTLRLAGTLDEARLEDAIKACLACLVRVSSATEQEIRDTVTGENELLARALREGVRRGLVTRSGEGKARKPYVYSVSRTRGETGERDNTDKTDKTDKHAQDGSLPLVRLVRESAAPGRRAGVAPPQREPGEEG